MAKQVEGLPSKTIMDYNSKPFNCLAAPQLEQKPPSWPTKPEPGPSTINTTTSPTKTLSSLSSPIQQLSLPGFRRRHAGSSPPSSAEDWFVFDTDAIYKSIETQVQDELILSVKSSKILSRREAATFSTPVEITQERTPSPVSSMYNVVDGIITSYAHTFLSRFVNSDEEAGSALEKINLDHSGKVAITRWNGIVNPEADSASDAIVIEGLKTKVSNVISGRLATRVYLSIHLFRCVAKVVRIYLYAASSHHSLLQFREGNISLIQNLV